MTELVLRFSDLYERHRGVTNAIGASYAEAARVCLDRHHAPPIEFSISADNRLCLAIAQWEPTNDRVRGAWANVDDATEDGAYCLAIAAVEAAQGLLAIRRAEKLTGADYYVAPSDVDCSDLEGWIRLEVSGVDVGTEQAIKQRLREKVRQALDGDSNLPAMAAVVGFLAKLIMMDRAEEAA